jgi:tetratricopeptide (TPR) repeat protein
MMAEINRPLRGVMESGLFFLGLLVALFAAYRLVLRRIAGPQAIVRGLLRHYHALEAAGLTEQECLFRILTRRSGWRNLPHAFLAELIKRLRTKEDVFRFVSLVEGYRFDRKDLPRIAASEELERAMSEIARWLGDFGARLQNHNRLKEAEFVQKLAFQLQPEPYFTNLPLAETYYRMERYAEALPLFEKGLARLREPASSLDGLESDADRGLSDTNYEQMYAACLKAVGKPVTLK